MKDPAINSRKEKFNKIIIEINAPLYDQNFMDGKYVTGIIV